MSKSDNSDVAYSNSLFELKVLATIGGIGMAWTILCSAMTGYGKGAPDSITFGIPTWAFWSVLVPWVVIGLFTIIFAGCVVTEDDADVIGSQESDSHSPDADQEETAR